jgi:hypothetical protein
MTALALKKIRLRLPASYVFKPAIAAAASLLIVHLLDGFFPPTLLPSLALGVLAVSLYGLFSLAVKAVDVREIARIGRGAL